MDVLCRMPTIKYSAKSVQLYLISGSLGPPKSSTQMASRSLQLFLQSSLSDRPTYKQTDHTTNYKTKLDRCLV